MATATTPTQSAKRTGYEILRDYAQITEWIAELEEEIAANGGVLPDWLAELFDGTYDDLRAKIEAYFLVAKHLETEAKSFKSAADPYLEEAARLRRKGQARENVAASLKARAREMFLHAGLDKYRGDVLTIFPVAVETYEPTVPVEELDDQWKRVTITPNKEAVREHVRAGGNVPAGWEQRVRIDVRSR